MNPITGKTIAIVGGGPGGLTLARLLQMSGASVKVYERDFDRSARVQGATLNLNDESGLKALRKAGLMNEFNSVYRPGAERLVFVDPKGNTLIEESKGGEMAELRPEIDRGPLRELLLDSLHPETVVWNSQFSSLERTESSVRLYFTNGESVEADLVIAADGANSKVRRYVTPIKPVYSGVTAIEGLVCDSMKTIPQIHRLLDGGKIGVLGDEKTLFIILKGDDSVAFYAGFNAQESWIEDSGIDFSNQAQVLSWFKKEFPEWNAMWAELFENASTPPIPRPQYCVPTNQSWETIPNLTLLGDAAHVMPPYAGEGVNMAMLDALELAENLLSPKFADARSAIAAYESVMHTRTSITAQMTLEFTSMFHSKNAVPFFRDFFNSL